jgi:putative DNA primase/helicase
LVAWLAAACRPHGPYPLLILQGEQGSAKSTTAKLLRRLIDPSTAPLRTPPREERDLVIAANNSWVVAYDNLSGIQPWLSDALCRLATGGGFSTRELYTDSDEVIFDLTRPVILNGIDHLAERPDLADRAIILNLPPIDESARREEADIYRQYEEERPYILGALCTAVSQAMACLPEVRLARKPRMADFAIWATAAEQSCGFQSGAFMSAYAGNRAEAVQETLESDPVSAAIIALINEEQIDGQWTGTAQDLLQILDGKVGLEPTASRLTAT